MNEGTKMKPEEKKPSDSDKNEKELAPGELGKVSGGRRSNDPCEGGQVTE